MDLYRDKKRWKEGRSNGLRSVHVQKRQDRSKELLQKESLVAELLSMNKDIQAQSVLFLYLPKSSCTLTISSSSEGRSASVCCQISAMMPQLSSPTRR